MSPLPQVDRAAFAAALLDPCLPCPAGLRSWNGSNTSARLAVHRNNVMSSLIDALAETFPVVAELVGEEFFRAMAAQFIRHSPPSTRVLSRYGGGFADFVACFPPASGLPYLADVARLEFARVQAYHSADLPPISDEAVRLALSSGEQMAELRLQFHPSLTVLESGFAVVSLWAAHQGEIDISSVDPAVAEAAIVLRKGLDVVVLRAPPGAATFVAAAQRGEGFARAAAAAADAHPEFELTALLGLLFEQSAVTAIHLPRGA